MIPDLTGHSSPTPPGSRKFPRPLVPVNVGELLLQRRHLGLIVYHDVGLIRVLSQVILVILFRAEEPAQLLDLRHDRAREGLRRGELLDVALRDLLLLWAVVEDLRAVLGAAIRALPV